MDTQDRLDANLPARLPNSATRSSIQTMGPRGMVAPVTPSEGMSIDPRSLLRGLARNWWRILLIWLVVSVPLVFVIFSSVKPTFRAVGAMQIETDQLELFGPTMWTREHGGPQGPSYLQTEVERLKSDTILKLALARPGVSELPMFRGAEDPLETLRKKLEIAIVPNTHFIQIAVESTDSDEAAEVVNAVIDVYQNRAKEVGTSEKKILVGELETYQKNLKETITQTQAKLREIAKRGNVEVQKPNLRAATPDSENDHALSFERVSVDQYRSVKDRLFQTDMQLLELEAQYQARQSGAQSAAEIQEALSSELSPDQRKQIEIEFKRDPEVAAVIDEIKSAQDELAHTKSVARKGADPAMVAVQARLKRLDEEYRQLWAAKSEQIRRRLLVPTSAQDLQSLAQLKTKIDELQHSKAKLATMLRGLEAESRGTHEDSVEATFLNADLSLYRGRFEQIDRRLEQLKFSKDKGNLTIKQTDLAQPPKVPNNNKRWKYMALLPVGVLAAVLGLFLLLEVKSERVADPDMLSVRVRSEVYALPPLPTRRNVRRLEGPVLDEQIDRFIQRLDHLRFAVCGDHRESDLGRCLLVTSAVGGEGKTTLAAQLAARCGNAGISTILIDADMRRAALSPLLDVPEIPGFSDVLNEEATLEEALVPVQGGTFTVLPAGTAVQDATSILQGRTLALVIAQLRQRYELIIIDSPPVLPVPDALILGRWTDGALLAARFEVSRSPQVERARNQLDSAGIPLLGTVINGMHSSDAYYGRYNHGRYRSTRTEKPRES